jgi:DNA-binding transcriptional regulator of glucitol operon
MEGSGVIVAEYFWKEPVVKTIGLTPDGRTIEDAKPPMDFVKTRKVHTHKVMWAKVSGKAVLEGPQEFPCSEIPVVSVVGEEIDRGDKVVRSSVIRYAKDPAQLYNYWSSADAELVALQPKAPYIVTTKQVEGLEDIWASANSSNDPYLPYNPDEKAPPPQRAQPPVSSAGMAQQAMKAVEDMKATTGIYDAGLGNRSNEQSGVAIRQRQMESDVANSIYSDNLAKSIARCGRILVDMIPKIYDTARAVRILGKDDAEKIVEINKQVYQPGLGMGVINPVTLGKYAVRVSVGPNYSTRRQETAESMMAFVKSFPQTAGMVSDLIADAMDWPNKDRFVDRLKKTLPPQLRDPDDMSPEEQQQMQGAMMEQQQAMQLEQQGQMVELQKQAAEAAEAEADAEKASLEVEEKELELAAQSGELNEAIAQLIQQEVARALEGAFQPGLVPQI